jgi:hypothetical protein
LAEALPAKTPPATAASIPAEKTFAQTSDDRFGQFQGGIG